MTDLFLVDGVDVEERYELLRDCTDWHETSDDTGRLNVTPQLYTAQDNKSQARVKCPSE